MSIIEETLNRLGQEQAGHARPAITGALPFDAPHKASPWPRLLKITLALSIALPLGTWAFLHWVDPAASLKKPAPQPARPTLQAQATPPVQPMPAPPAQASAPQATAPQTQPPQTAATPAAQPAAPQAPAPEAKPAAQPAWLTEGHRLLAAGNTEGALRAWSAGFASLPPQQRVIAIAAYPEQGAALTALKKLGGMENAFIASSQYKGEKAWRLLALSSPDKRQDDLNRAVTQTGVKGSSITTAGKVGGAPAETATPREASVPAKPAVEARPAPAASRAAAPAPAKKGASGQADYILDGRAERIAQALNSGNYRDAEEIARPLLTQYPANGEPWLWMGKAELGLGNAGEAERYLSRATELNPNAASAWTLRGIAAQERGNHAQALTFFAEAQRLSPNQADTYLNIGYSQDALGKRGEAEAAWRRFLELAGDKPRFAKQRAYIEQRLTQGR